MNHKTVEKYLLSLPGAKLDYPFGKEVAVYKVFVKTRSSALHFGAEQGASEKPSESYQHTKSEVSQQSDIALRKKPRQSDGLAGTSGEVVQGDWRMFALIPEGTSPVRISLKCDPELALTLREKYETVMPGYHLNKKHWNTVVLSGQLPWEEVRGLIDHSYQLVSGKSS